ncbi:TonB-dependent receptor [Parahaliea mediterranea]|uniref:TonB-dependent receptor n=1 Tax=Parahaliea mediterranea TaxID=651086 RepID=A0A939DE35_9GAMM|nr:TonB-dependent receptor [Parahaliea mediterranea]MBN7796420.1 TonB-dependent receptor [Parahaliea mediterranea]
MKYKNQIVPSSITLANAVVVATSLMNPSQALAENYALEEVIVSAQRRSESLQEVPVSVTAIGGESVGESGIAGLNDISRQTPGFTMTQYNIAEPQLYIRGIGSTQDSAASDSPVAMFVDDVYIGRSGGASFELYDIERIEVLRGPQGTLFGKNVVGGAVSVVTSKPSEEFKAKLGVTAGNLGLKKFTGLINGAITDNVAGKFAFSKKDTDGYAENISTGQDTHDVDNLSTRAQLAVFPSDNLEILLGADYSTDENNGNCRSIGELDEDTRPLTPIYRLAVAATTQGDIRKCTGDVETYQERDLGGLLAKVTWDTPLATFSSISAYRESDYKWLDDLSGLPAATLPLIVHNNAEEQADQFSQELRLTSNGGAPLQWIAGYYYMRENVDRRERFDSQVGNDDPTSIFGPNGPLGAATLLGGNVEFFQDAKSDSHAVFAQANYHFTDDFSASFGGRWSYDKKKINQSALDYEGQGHTGVPLSGAPPYANAEASESWSEFTPSLSLNYQINDNGFVYFTAANGYKSGAFIGQAMSAESATTPLEPETVTNYEIGAKTEWFGNRLRLNVSAFNMEYSDLQVFTLKGFSLVSDNAEATSQGLDVEFVAAVTDRLRLSGSWSYLDAEYDTYISGDDDYSGNVLPRAPKHSRNIKASYYQPLPRGSELELSLSYDYKSSFFFDPDNSPLREEEAVELINANASWYSSGQDWRVVAWVKNLADEEYRLHSAISGFAGTVNIYAPPRSYGLTVDYTFR